MSAQHSNPPPEPGTPAAQQPAEGWAGEQKFADAHLQIDPLQSFREYSSPVRPQVSNAPVPPVYSMPNFYQPGTPGPIPVPPGYSQPGNGGYMPGVAGYPSYSGQTPGAWPGYPPHAVHPGQYPGYYPYAPYAGYPGYPGYGYGWPPVAMQPKRDTYLLVVGIIAFACSCLAVLGGLASLGLMGLVDLAFSSTTVHISSSEIFASTVLFLTLALAGLVGGAFCMYHSIRSLFLRKASRTIWLPQFWIFLLCYLVVLGLGFWLHANGLDVSSSTLTAVLIYLGAIFPALTILALGIRRLSLPKRSRRSNTGQDLRLTRRWRWRSAEWPTTWRRLTLALVSGATLSIVLASILELVLELIVLGSQSAAITQYISDPNAGNPPSSLYGLLLVLLSVIAPLVEELVKPLAVVVLIGRVRNKAEAFTLGLACGIGFNLVETTGYISSGYNDWLSVAIVRSGAGLLHGFGAAMVALGWYYLTHKEEGRWQKRALIAVGCGGYAVLQHALWNGSVGLTLLPGPLGDFFQNWSWSLGSFTLDGIELVNIAEMIGILIFFIYMSGRLRARPVEIKPDVQPVANALAAPV